jgi:hypothetical protein
MIARGFKALFVVFLGFLLSANPVFADGNLVIDTEKRLSTLRLSGRGGAEGI